MNRAVLWDMDGTLIDSEELHWIAWRDTMANEGSELTHEQFLCSFGQRNDVIICRCLGGSATSECIERISNAKEEVYRHLVRKNGISPLPGVTDWVLRLQKQGWLQAITSAAPRANIEVILELLAASHHFQGIISAEDVYRGKPDPEVYLAAATLVGVAPERCLVVEDAAAGIEGARRAGMRSIGVSRDGRYLAAYLVVRSLDALDSDAFQTLLRTSTDSNCTLP